VGRCGQSSSCVNCISGTKNAESATGFKLLDNLLKEVNDQLQSLSEKIVGFTEEIDTFFINDDQEKRINYTHIQLGYRYTHYKNQAHTHEPVFSARIHLPRTQNRLTLEVSNNNPFTASNETATNNTNAPVATDPAQINQAIDLGLGYVRDIASLFNAKVTAGLKLQSDKINVFANLQFYRSFYYEKWSMRLSEELYRDNIIFNRSTSQLLFERTMAENLLFRSITKNIYYYDLGYSQNHQTFSLLNQLSDHDAMIYQLGGMWEKPLDLLNYELDNYYALVRYSSKIYRDWLIMEIATKVQILKVDNFRVNPLISLQFSAFFGNN